MSDLRIGPEDHRGYANGHLPYRPAARTPPLVRQFRDQHFRDEDIQGCSLETRKRAFLSGLVDLAWRTVFRLGYPFAHVWWWLTRPQHEGAVVAIYVGSALLIVRPSYRRGWQLPGGGVRRDETPEAAARRELIEEIGLTAPVLLPAGIVCGIWDGRRDRVHFFELRLAELPKLQLDNREIIEARLITPHQLRNMALTGPTAAYLDRLPVSSSFHPAWS